MLLHFFNFYSYLLFYVFLFLFLFGSFVNLILKFYLYFVYIIKSSLSFYNSILYVLYCKPYTNKIKDQKPQAVVRLNLINFCVYPLKNKNFFNLVFGKGRCFTTFQNNSLLNPWFLTGFTDAEASFNMVVAKSNTASVGWIIQARFVIELHTKDTSLLTLLQAFLGGVGTVTKHATRKSSRFSVVNLDHLVNVIIPHFDNYPLQSAINTDYLLWKKSFFSYA